MRYYIFGASKMGEFAFRMLEKQFNIVGFLDNDQNKHGKEFCGILIYSPQEILNSNSNIIIASQFFKEIEMQIIGFGINNYKIFKVSLEDSYAKFESTQYWEERYKNGGNSGTGSYNHLAEFKAKIINEFVETHDIRTVSEWGVGDGNQLSLMKYPRYVGYDVSKTAISLCKEKFKGDQSKEFHKVNGDRLVLNSTSRSELSLSLDVIYHLVEDHTYEMYLDNLFNSSSKFVCIYSSNYDSNHVPHVRDREFLPYVYEKMSDWKLIKFIENNFLPEKVTNKDLEVTNSNFYFFEKIS